MTLTDTLRTRQDSCKFNTIKMRTVSEKCANSSNHSMANVDFFSKKTITVPIGLRLFAIALLSLSYTIGKIFG